MTDKVQEIQKRVEAAREDIIKFMRDIVAIPSMDSQIGEVGKRIQEEMKKLGYDEIRYDKMGNTIGRIGNGKKVIVFDSHIDTVGIGDPASWQWDPFVGKVENGVLYARGACDEKNSTPGMIYGLAIAVHADFVRVGLDHLFHRRADSVFAAGGGGNFSEGAEKRFHVASFER